MSSRGVRCLAAVAFCGLASSLPDHAVADPAIERRLAALRSLERPGAAPTRGAGALTDFQCPKHATWLRSPRAAEQRLHRAVRDAALRFAVPAALLRSVIRHESAGRRDAVSSAGALGVMQLMPATARSLGVVCPFDPRENVIAGARYLRRLRDQLGSWEDAIAGYNAGPARVRSGRLPAETRAYRSRVLRSWRGG